MWKCGIGLIGASLMKAGDLFCQILSSSWCRRCNVWQLLSVTSDFQLFLCARVWTEIQVQESNWRKIFDETKTGWWRQWAAMQERGSDNEGAGRRNLLGKSFCVYTAASLTFCTSSSLTVWPQSPPALTWWFLWMFFLSSEWWFWSENSQSDAKREKKFSAGHKTTLSLHFQFSCWGQCFARALFVLEQLASE